MLGSALGTHLGGGGGAAAYLGAAGAGGAGAGASLPMALARAGSSCSMDLTDAALPLTGGGSAWGRGPSRATGSDRATPESVSAALSPGVYKCGGVGGRGKGGRGSVPGAGVLAARRGL